MLNAIARPSRAGQLFGHVSRLLRIAVAVNATPLLPPHSSSNTLIRVPVIYALGKRHKEGAIDIGTGRIKTPFRTMAISPLIMHQGNVSLS